MWLWSVVSSTGNYRECPSGGYSSYQTRSMKEEDDSIMYFTNRTVKTDGTECSFTIRFKRISYGVADEYKDFKF
jgi:hypothetical protein